ncbi:MAG: EAL domain-containing protein [Colwellia sp.]|nr:EAL domain-containing protein [Colwellia sp.]
MFLSDLQISQLAIVSGKVALYTYVTIALAYIYASKHKGFFLFIVSFGLFALTRSGYIVNLLTDIGTIYHLTIYCFAIAFLAIASIQYNQKVNILPVGLVAATLFSFVISFLSTPDMMISARIYSLLLHAIVITSFCFRMDKNVGDFFVIFGLSVSSLWGIIIWFFPTLFFTEQSVAKVMHEFIQSVGGYGLTIGLLLRIILGHKNELRKLTLIDDLSGLANRRALTLYVDKLTRSESPFQFSLIRIRGIRHINEHYGHQAGDEELYRISNKLREYLIGEDLNKTGQGYLARLNGSYLVYIHLNNSKKTNVELLLSNCIEQCSSRNTQLQVGIANYPEHGSHFIELLTASEIVLTKCKTEYINCLNQVNSTKLEEYRYRQELAKGLVLAIKNEDIDVHYQPKYTLIDGIIAGSLAQPVLIGAEALARWTYQGKVISPFIFIQLAEEYDLIADLDALIMKKAWSKASELERLGHTLKIAVNYSSTSMAHKDKLLEQVCYLIDSFQLSPSLLEVEITESAMAPSGNTNEQLQKLRQLGISIAIDDFGTGYSNLSQLQALPLDTIKIDKAFIDLIETTPMVTEFIIEMAHKLKLNIVAEGVEQQMQLDWLTARGCQQIQGYLLNKPLTANDFFQLVTKC